METAEQYMNQLLEVTAGRIGEDAVHSLDGNILVVDFKPGSKNKDYKFVFELMTLISKKHVLVCRIILKQAGVPEYLVRQDVLRLGRTLTIDNLEQNKLRHQLKDMLNIINEDFDY